jgi:CheY-like chemotaxis protein/signal transduction histidine kinase
VSVATQRHSTRTSAAPPEKRAVLLLGARDGDAAWIRGALGPLERVPVEAAASLDDALARVEDGEVSVVCADVDVDVPPRRRGAAPVPWVVLADETRRGDAHRRLREGAWDVLVRGQPEEDTAAALRRALAFGAGRADDAARARRLGDLLVEDVEAVLGTLAASVAHGINTPLTGALAGVGITRHIARTLLNTLAGEAEVDRGALREMLEAMLEASDDARLGIDGAVYVTRGVGALGARDDEGATTCDLARVLDAAHAVTQTIVRHRAELVRRVDPLPPVLGSEARLGKLCLMLLLGAARAIPEGAVTGNAITVVAEARGGRVTLTVEDTGAARSGDASARVRPRYDRWISACRSLATALGGELVAAPMARGTRLTLTLRAAEGGAAAAGASALPGARVAGGAAMPRGRVLIVDDEPVLLNLMRRIVQRDHDVVATTQAAEAVARLQAGERFDVFLCDLMMPSMSGIEVHRRVTLAAPEMAERMVFITAGAFTEHARAFLQRATVSWLEKPIDPDDLRALIDARVARG